MVVGGFRIGIAAGRRTGTELTSERCSAETEAEAEAGKRPVQYSALYFVKASLEMDGDNICVIRYRSIVQLKRIGSLV